MKIVSGGCPGCGYDRNIRPQQRSDLRSFSRKLESVRKKAGPIEMRNGKNMLPDIYSILIAFWDGKSHGTKEYDRYCKRHGLEIHIVQI